MRVQFTTTAVDLPPNLESGSVSVLQVLLYFAPVGDATLPAQPVASLTFVGSDGSGSPKTVAGAATAVGGVISTRRGNAPGWIPMIGMQAAGTWTLDLSDPQTAALFQNSAIQDLLFVLTYTGRLPAWPT